MSRLDRFERPASFGRRIAQILIALVLIGIGFLAGLYWMAPRLSRAETGYVPRAVAQLPVGVMHLTNPDGSATFLPVRLAETTEARRAGLNEVGPAALDTLFFLYAPPRAVGRTAYNIEGIRAPLEFAVINAEGEVITLRNVTPGARTISVADTHRYVLAAKQGMLEHYGIGLGSVMDIDNLVTLTATTN